MNRREFLGALAAAPLAAREDDTAAQWSQLFSTRPPFSFMYGGRPSSALLPKWKSDVRTSQLDVMRTRQEFTYTDAESGLVVRAAATVYKDFPALEWVLNFHNTGTAETPILADIQTLDTMLRSASGDPVIHYAKGAVCSMDDFMPLRRALNTKGRLRVQPGGGRSSSDYLPFFNIETRDGNGVVIGIGWSGEWAAAFTRDTGPEFRAQAGMDRTHLRLRPGEQIRTPLVLALFWEGGDRMRGHNLLRRFILKYHRPSAGGQLVNMPLCNSNWGGTKAADHLENIRQIVTHRLPMDYYWIDAEWFGKGPWYVNPGDWNVKKDLYPDGFKPISDALHRAGHKLLLWFEPERVCEGTPWDREHREWLLEVPTGEAGLQLGRVAGRSGVGGQRKLSQPDSRKRPAIQPGQSRRTPVSHRFHLRKNRRVRIGLLPARRQHRAARILARRRPAGPAGHYGDPVGGGVVRLLGRTAAQAPEPDHRQLRQRRAAHRPRVAQPHAAAVAHGFPG